MDDLDVEISSFRASRTRANTGLLFAIVGFLVGCGVAYLRYYWPWSATEWSETLFREPPSPPFFAMVQVTLLSTLVFWGVGKVLARWRVSSEHLAAIRGMDEP